MHTFRCGDGAVEVDDDGLVSAVRHPLHPDLNALLDERAAPWFGPDFRWGTGLLITDRGSGRFAAPHTMAITHEVVGTYEPVPGLQVEVTRTFGDSWQERYVLRNLAHEPATVGSFAINTPIADAYGPARTVLTSNLHAHVWTGGAESWLVGVRMDGTPPALVLDLTEGELWAYSISGRHQFTSSNVRGVISLHATDHARAPHAFGGQPVVTLEPGEELRLGWELGWYDDVPAALAGHRATIAVPWLAAPVGTAIAVGERDVVAHEHGVSHVDVPHADGRRSRVAVLHHTPVEELVRLRVATIVSKHRASERPGTRGAAFVPYDVERDLRLTHDLGWTDWSDSRERVGMPLLLLAARQRGWCDDLDEHLLAYKAFCREHLLTREHRIRNSSTADGRARLYNSPWFALLFAELFATYGFRDDLLTAVAILDRYYADGGERFLAIAIAEAATRVADLCEANGLAAEAVRVRAGLVQHGLTLAALGIDLPEHEVAYEQSMTAPLLSILSGAWRISPSPSPELVEAMRTVLPWLLAFAGRQPHVRLRNVPIRHWDGYWFGRLRLYGDTFPHYWSILSPRALLDLPAELGGDARHGEIVRDVTAANLVDFTPDGNASCAFLMPSCVDDQPGYRADPLANDQDMGLALTLLPGTGALAPVDVIGRLPRRSASA